jgi:hypothetical protein
MALAPDPVWAKKFTDLPKVRDLSWAANIANATDELATNMLEISGLFPGGTFTFKKGVFQAQLLPIVAAPVSQGALIAAAWGAAVQASTFSVSAGTIVGAPSPATIFSAPPVALILPPSIAAAQGALAVKLTSLLPVSDPAQSQFGPALRAAFLMLQVSITGIDSTPSPAGPLPLIVPAQPTV